jgi:ParB family chromosome partitioning protein
MGPPPISDNLTPPLAAETPVPQFASRAAIGAISRSIHQLKAQAEIELDPALIDPPPVIDRLDESPAAFAEFLHNIDENGQQVPILVRPHPNQPGRYQFAYGRRRLRAVRELGRPVRAIVKPLSDAELVIAQGQENSQRKDLSFIEKALYAADLEQNGQTRDTIMQALGIDKTGLSKLISVAEQVPHRIIRAIGPAPKAGRDRWLELASRIKTVDSEQIIDDTVNAESFRSMESDERFVSLFTTLAPKRPSKPRMKAWKAGDGTRAARFKQDEKGTTIVIDGKAAPDFGNFVLASLGDLYEASRKTRQS